MLALKDLANRLGSGNIWHEGGFPEMSGEGRGCECRRPPGGGSLAPREEGVVTMVGWVLWLLSYISATST